MQYRKLGSTDLDVGVIGLGTEYLLHTEPAMIASVLAQAADGGINYVDLLYTHAEFLEKFAPALAPHRERLLLAVHLRIGEEEGEVAIGQDPVACVRTFEGILARLHTGHADVILVQLLDSDDSCLAALESLFPVAERLREQGKGRFIAVSAHRPHTALAAVQSGRFGLLMYPVNLAGGAVPGTAELLTACAARGVGVVAMKPFAGGRLLGPRVTGYMHWFQAGGEYVEMSKRAALTPAQCLGYALSRPAVCTTVPGVKDTAELATALHYLEASEAEVELGEDAAEFRTFVPGECQYCNHCLPCPAGIDIGEVIRLADRARLGMTAELRAAYAALPAKASDCTFCDACVERCPFKVLVADRMFEARGRFEALA